MVENADKAYDMLNRIERDLPDLLGSLDTMHSIRQYEHPNEKFHKKPTLRVIIVDEEVNNGFATVKMENLVAEHDTYAHDDIETRDGITEEGQFFVDFTATY